MLILLIIFGYRVSSSGLTGLDYHRLWERQQYYPRWATRMGHIWETYIESPYWQNIKEQIFRQPAFALLVLASGLLIHKGKPKKKNIYKYGLWLGLAAGALLFIWQLTSIPSGVYVDEAVTGYNAYSLLVTGRDEWGKAFPILFRYFGSWLPWLNLYFLVPAVKVLGLSALAVRLPAAILGVGVILVTYVLITLKTGKKWVAGLGALFLPVVPWMVFNARLGYEEMLGYILFASGCGLLWRSVKDKTNLKWAILAWSLSSYDAHVFRYLMGIIFPVWVWFYRKEIKMWPKSFIFKQLGWLVITQLPHVAVVNTPAFWVKQVIYKNVGITPIANNFIGQIREYFSLSTLFERIGDIDMQHQIPGTGLFVWWMVFPVTWGVVGWVKKWRENGWWLVLLLLSIFPAALSGAFISVQRALPLLLPLIMAMAEGMSRLVGVLNKRIGLVIVATLWLYSLFWVFRSYFVLLPATQQQAWNYGYEQLARVVKENPQTHFVIDNSRNVRNYMLLLFHLRYSPRKLQSEVDPKVVENYYFSGDMDQYHSFGNMEFRSIDWKNDECRKQILVGDSLSVSYQQATDHDLKQTGQVVGKNGDILLKWYETNPDVKCEIAKI